MPGNLSSAVATTVLPRMLYIAYQERRQYPMLENVYHDGYSERALITDGVNPSLSGRQWNISARLTSTQVATLYTYFLNRKGDLQPFWFYAMNEIAPIASTGFYDPTGVSTLGRYVVRFSNQSWQQQTDLSLTNVSFGLYQVS